MKLHRVASRYKHLAQFAKVAGLLLAVVLTLVSSLALAKSTPATAAANTGGGDEQGELVGDLVFHADLLSALDQLCPSRVAASADWHGALRRLLDKEFTPELRTLSRRLGADAGAQLVHERGGCSTRGFAAAYNESKDEYRALLQRWKALGD
jgi:hypothetical protein